jgi:hypothetical protein
VDLDLPLTGGSPGLASRGGRGLDLVVDLAEPCRIAVFFGGAPNYARRREGVMDTVAGLSAPIVVAFVVVGLCALGACSIGHAFFRRAGVTEAHCANAKGGLRDRWAPMLLGALVCGAAMALALALAPSL